MKRGRTTTVTMVAVAVGLLAVSVILMILAAFVDEFRTPVALVSGALALSGFVLIALLYYGWEPEGRSVLQVPLQGETLVGRIAEVRTADMVYVNGALWRAECDEPLVIGEKVNVVSVDGLTLKVRRQP